MSKKKILTINLNEFNLDFLKYGAIKYNCPNIKKLLKFKKISTYSKDRIQDKNLDPWVQSICINSGKRSKNHGIFNLGEKIPKNLIQIWDSLSNKKRSSAIWGPMNTRFKDNKYIKIFVPDPWNNQMDVKPTELKSVYNLARMYAQNYSNFSFIKTIPSFTKFFWYLLKTGIIFKLLRSLPSYLNIILKNGIKNYFLFFLFDVISLHIFSDISKNKKIDFSLIFLNSLAHFQHNNWDNKNYEKDYFFFSEKILEIIFKIYKEYDSIIVYNGFSQKKIKSEYMLRPIDPKQFFSDNNIRFKKFHSNMTNGALITFKDNRLLKKEYEKIKKINILGFKLFNINTINSTQVFCRFQIRSKFDFNIKNSSKNDIKKNIFYENKESKIKNNINENIEKFLKNIIFIKTTSKHISNGNLFYENLKIRKKKVENVQINNIIKNYL